MSREKAMRFLESRIQVLKAQQNGLNALLVAVNLGLKDKNSQVILRALNIYQEILTQFKPQMSKKGVDSGVYQTINLLLFDKLGDSNSKIKTKALHTSEKLFLSSYFQSGTVFQFFFKKQSYLKPGSYQNPSHLLGRLEILNKLINSDHFSNLGLPVNSTLDFIVNRCMRISSQKKARQLSLQAIFTLYKQIGFDQMEGYLTDKGLSEQLKETLRLKIPELDAILPQKKKYEGVPFFKHRNGEEEMAAHDPSVKVISKKKTKKDEQEEKK